MNLELTLNGYLEDTRVAVYQKQQLILLYLVLIL